jgi:hypothetical protein
MVDFDTAADRISNKIVDFMRTHQRDVQMAKTQGELSLITSEFNALYYELERAVKDAKFAMDGYLTNLRVVRSRLAERYYSLPKG